MRDAGSDERSLPRSRRRGNAGKPPTATIAEDWSVRDRLQKKGAKKRSLERWLFDSTSRAHREPREAYRYLRKLSPPRHPSDRRGRASRQGAHGAHVRPRAPPIFFPRTRTQPTADRRVGVATGCFFFKTKLPSGF